MMKVLFIHNTIPEYRLEFFRLLARKVDLHILVTDKELANAVYGLFVGDIGNLNISYINSCSKIGSVINKGKYDMVILPPIDCIYQWICAFNAYNACRRCGINLVYWSEKWEAEKSFQPFSKQLKNYIHAKMIGYFAKRVSLCIAAGSKSKEYLLKRVGIEASRISIAYDSSTSPIQDNHLDIRKGLGLPAESKIILYLGRIIERKGLKNLIYSVEEILSDMPDVYLLVGGTGEDIEKYKRIARKIDRERIVFMGKIAPGDRACFYKQADVFVLPSYSYKGIIEAWGLTVNEALEQGTPVIATSAVGAAYDLNDGKCCIKVPENNVMELVKAIKSVLNNTNNRELCRDLYSKFSVGNMANQFFQALSKYKNLYL